MTINYQQALKAFEHPQVRDLVWVIGSPALMSQVALPQLLKAWDQPFIDQLKLLTLSSDQLFQFALPHLTKLEEEPERLLTALNNSREQYSRVRLGIYYEHLVHYFFESIMGFSPLLRELQIFDCLGKGKRTVGSLDMIGQLQVPLDLKKQFQSERSTCHIEVASKFYLKVPRCEAHQPKSPDFPFEFSRYIGPNEKDSFGSKLHRLLTHQLPLSLTAYAQPVLQAHQLQVTHRILWCKGRLFLPLSEAELLSVQGQPQDWIEQEIAIWLRQRDIASLFHSELFNNEYIEALLCPKPQWLAPPSIKNFYASCQSYNEKTLLESCQSERGEKGATLWYLYSQHTHKFIWVMIVPNDWGKRT